MNYSIGVLPKLLWSFLLISFTSIHAVGQDKISPTVWLRPNAGISQSEEVYIGNYPVLNKIDKSFMEAISTIAEGKKGTLFMVGRFETNGQDQVQFGAISVSAKKAIIGAQEFTYPELDEKASMLMLAYNISTKYKKPAHETYFSENVEIAEVIWFEKGLRASDARIVETYLALKYSINITENDDEEKRNYINRDEIAVWDFPRDFQYDEEVLALGRSDYFNFNQTQTYSSDAQATKLSLEQPQSLGKMPEQNLVDNAFVLISKKNTQTSQIQCGGGMMENAWKIRFYQWKLSFGERLVFQFDTVISAANYIMSDGQEQHTVELDTSAGVTTLKIPLTELDFSKQYYLAIVKEKQCDPQCKMEALHCATDSSGINQLSIKIDENALSATILLVNQNTKASFEYYQSEYLAKISHLPQGQYEVLIRNSHGTLINETVTFTACGNANAASEPSFSQWPKEQTNNSQSASARGINAYPNPTVANATVEFDIWGFQEAKFDIQISDLNGRIIANENYQTNENTKYQYAFEHAGTYQVKFSTKDYTEVKRIIVH